MPIDSSFYTVNDYPDNVYTQTPEDAFRFAQVSSEAASMPVEMVSSRASQFEMSFEQEIGKLSGTGSGVPQIVLDKISQNMYLTSENPYNNAYATKSGDLTSGSASVTPSIPTPQGSLPLQANFAAEKTTDRHRFGDLINKFLDYYNRRRWAVTLSWSEWANGLSHWDAYQIVREINQNLPPQNRLNSWQISQQADAFVNGVRYLSVKARGSYAVEIRNGRLHWKGKPFDTAKLETHFSGLGWAIWVQSPRDVFYTNSHLKARFHHSSFLSGDNIMCGGEWKVEDGTLTMITAKSGHYLPKMPDFYRALMTLRLQGVHLLDADLVLYTMIGKQPTVFPVIEALDNWHAIHNDYMTGAIGTAAALPKQSAQPRRFLGNHRI